MASNRATFVEDDEDESEYVIDDVEVVGGEDDRFWTREIKKAHSGDSFARIPYESLDKNAKRRATTMVKRLQGVDGVGTKHVTLDEINGYQLYGLAMPPYNLDYLVELATTNSTHYSCCVAKAVNIVGLGYKWEETNKVKQARLNLEDDDDKMQKMARKLSNVQDRLDEWLDGMNEEDGFIDTLMKVWMDYEATGNGYLEVGRNRNGSIGYIGHIPAEYMRVRVKRDGFVQLVPGMSRSQIVFFKNFGEKSDHNPINSDPKPNEVIHFKKQAPGNSYYGIPDIIAGLPAVAGDKFASEYNLEYFENKAVPRYALIVKGARLSATSERKILEYFRKEVKGKHHGTLYIPVPAAAGSNVDVKLEAIENKTQEASFDKYRAGNRLEIMMVHRVPPSQLGVEQDGSMAGARESGKMFKEQVIKPEQRKAQRKIRLIIKEYTDMYTLKFVEYDLVDEETRSRIHDRYVRIGVENPNEIRAELGKAPRKGGDKYVLLPDESEANVELRHAQAEVALNPRAKPLAPGEKPGGTGQKPGAKRQTTDGSPKNSNPQRTPADGSSGTGRAPKGSNQDAGRTRPSTR